MNKNKPSNLTQDTALSGGQINRRSILKAGAATGAILAAPAIVSNAFASSGELDILMWSDYLPDDFIAGFAAETGIKINFTGIGSNEEIINKMKAK